MHARIGAVAIAGLPEVGCVSVKLPPTDGYFVAVGRVDRNRWLVRGVAYDVVPLRIDVDLIADKRAELRNHLWLTLQPVSARQGRLHLVFRQRVGEAILRWQHLRWSAGERGS